MLANYADSFVIDDRRRGLRSTISGAAIEVHARGMITFMKGRPPVHTLVATRGERLRLDHTLVHGSAGDAGPTEIEALVLYETDDDERLRTLVMFDADNLDDAYDELDARYAASEGASTADAFSVATRAGAALLRRDWVALAACLDDDYAFVDHRSLSVGRFLGDLDREGLLRSMQELVSLSPRAKLRMTAVLRLSERGMVYRQSITGEGAGEGNFENIENTGVMVGVFRDGRLQRNEIFADSDLDAALRRYEELVGEPALLQNSCTRVAEMIDTAMLRGDVDAILARLAEHSVQDDRRSGIRLEIAGDAVRDGWRIVAEFCAGHGRRRTTLATRGDRLALHAVTVQGTIGAAGDAEVSFLLVEEIDTTGLIAHNTLFDSVDLAGAVARLDECYLAQLPPDDAAVWQAMCTLTDCYNRRDREGLRTVLSDDCVIVDDRLTSWGTLDRDAFIGHFDDLLVMAPDTVLMPVVVHTIGSAGSVARMRTSGTVPDGGDFEMLFECMSCVRDGKVVRLELLPDGDTQEALRRLSAATTGRPA